MDDVFETDGQRRLAKNVPLAPAGDEKEPMPFSQLFC